MAGILFRKILLITLLVTGIAAQAVAQVAPSPIVILNQDVLYGQSLFGQRVQRLLVEKSDAVSVENRTIEAELLAEELALTEQRPDLEPVDFRAKADAFDLKVEEIRNRQGKKAAEIDTWALGERQRFFQTALPVLVTLTAELGAAVVLDSRTVVLATDNIDITQMAITRINETLGDGSAADQ